MRGALIGLVVGLAVGYLLGALSRPERVERARGPSVAAPRFEPDGAGAPAARRQHESSPVRDRAPPPPQVVAVAAAPEASPVPDTEPVESGLEDGRGRLVVEFRGTAVELVRVVGRSIEGREQRDQCNIDDEDAGTGSLDLNPGRYQLRWKHNGDEFWRTASVVIRDGRATHVRLADTAHGVDLPVPAGLGRLDVRVGALGGGPLANAPVEVIGFGMNDEETLTANASELGLCRFHLIGGRYTVRIGDRVERADVVEGRTTSVTIDYRHEGEIVLRPRCFGNVRLRDRGATGVHTPTLSHRGARARLYYVAAGRYDVELVVLPAQGWRRIGEVWVSAGAATEFEYEPPVGGVRVQTTFASGATEEATILLQGPDGLALVARPEWNADRTGHAWFPSLSPGRYVLTAVAPGCPSVRREVTVGDDTPVVEITLADADRATPTATPTPTPSGRGR